MELSLTLDRQRQAIFDGLTDAAKELFFKILQKARTLGQLDIATRYEIGEMLVEAVSAPHTYGAGVVDQYAKILGNENAKWILYQCKKVAERFTREELDAIATRQFPDGSLVTWTHVRMLAEIEDKRRRKSILEQMLKKGLSTQELRKLVSPPSKNERQAPLRIGAPRNALGALDQIRAFGEALIAQAEAWDSILWSGLENAADVTLNEDVLEKLRTAVLQLEEMATIVGEQLNKARATAEKVQTILSKRAALKGRAAEAAPAEAAPAPASNGKSGDSRAGVPVQARPQAAWHTAKQNLERIKRARAGIS